MRANFMHLTRRLRIYALSDDRYLVCNALTGEVSAVSGSVYRQMLALRDGRWDECDPALLDALAEKRLAFRSHADEDAAFRALVEQALADYLKRARTEYCFAVNTHCNFNCVYCFEPAAARASVATLSADQIAAAFRFIDDAAAKEPKAPEPEYTLYGGEPLLLPSKPAVISLLEQVAARGHQANIITNGHSLAGFFDVFDTYHHAIGSVQITLDGTECDHNQRRVLKGGMGTFSTIVANIDAFLRRNYPTHVSIRTSFDKNNLHGVAALNRFLEARGWSRHPRVHVFPVTIQDHRSCGSLDGLIGYDDLLEAVLPYSTDSGGGPFDLSSIHVLGHVRNFLGRVAKRGPTGAFSPRATFCGGTAQRLFVFHPDGRMYPCYETTTQPRLAIGTYHPVRHMDQAMGEQWSGARLLRQPECFECSISTFCGGGCASAALAKTGALNRAYCEGAQDVFDRYFRLIGKMYREGVGMTSNAQPASSSV